MRAEARVSWCRFLHKEKKNGFMKTKGTVADEKVWLRRTMDPPLTGSSVRRIFCRCFRVCLDGAWSRGHTFNCRLILIRWCALSPWRREDNGSLPEWWRRHSVRLLVAGRIAFHLFSYFLAGSWLWSTPDSGNMGFWYEWKKEKNCGDTINHLAFLDALLKRFSNGNLTSATP